MIYQYCLWCKNIFPTYLSRIKRGKSKFCSKDCQYKSMKGKSISPDTQFKKGNSLNKGYKNGQWKGNEVGYSALHTWVRRTLGTPEKCENCNSDREKAYDWANKSKKYLRKKDDWIRLCRSCHQKYDKVGKKRRSHGIAQKKK